MGEEEQMNQTPNAQLPTPNAERSEHSTLGVERSALDVGRFLWRILDLFSPAFSSTPERSRQLIRFSSLTTSTITNFCRGLSASRSRFIFRGWKFSVRSGLCFGFYIVARFRF